MYEDIKHGDKKMSFLIFAYRKLSLKRKISDGNYRLLLLNDKLDQKTRQIGEVQQAISSAKNITNIFCQQSLLTVQNDIMQKYTDGNGNMKEGVNQVSVMQEMNKAQMQTMFGSNIVNSIFETASKAQLAQLNAEDKQIEGEKSNLESQLSLWAAELKKVEEGEDQAAKQAAPKFGLSG